MLRKATILFLLFGITLLICAKATATNFSSESGDSEKERDYIELSWLKHLYKNVDSTLDKAKLDYNFIKQPSVRDHSFARVGRLQTVDKYLENPMGALDYLFHRANTWQKTAFPFTLYCKTFLNGPDYEKDTFIKTSIYTFYSSGLMHAHGGRVIPRLPVFLNNMPPKAQNIMQKLLVELYTAHQLRQSAFRNLNKEEMQSLTEKLPKLFQFNEVDDISFLNRELDKNPNIDELLDLLRKVDYDKLWAASALMEFGVRSFSEKTFKNEILKDNPGDKPILWQEWTPLGKIVIGNTGDNVYDHDIAVIIDIGGNDTYKNNAGGAFPGGPGLSLVLDLEGNDKYIADKPFAQGAGAFGIGMLVDKMGNDIYKGQSYSQGAGLVGVGQIWDTTGDDQYNATSLCQGAGHFGFGIIIDDLGDDNYETEGFGQAFASTLGVGLLIDSSGDDSYKAKSENNLLRKFSFSQGSSMGFIPEKTYNKTVLSGGLSMLYDAKGNDLYKANSFSQGCGYVFGFGSLVDQQGDDEYYGGDFSQGSGAQSGIGLLFNNKGQDVYNARRNSQGSGFENSVGQLYDVDGDDTYRVISGQGIASGQHSFGLFFDAFGDDIYNCVDKGQGHGELPLDPIWHATAFFVDTAGNDDYSINEKSKNLDKSKWQNGNFGFGMDLNFNKPKATKKPFDNKLPQPEDIKVEYPFLMSPDVFVCFQQANDLTKKSDWLTLVQIILSKGQQNNRRLVLDVLDYLRVNKKDKIQVGRQQLLNIGRVDDNEVQMFFIQNIGYFYDFDIIGDFKEVDADDILDKIASLKHVSGSEEKEEFCKKLVEIFKKESSVSFKVAGIETIRRLRYYPAIEEAINDPDWEIRREVAKSLVFFSDNRKKIIHKHLHELVKDKHEAVRLEALKSMIKLFKQGHSNFRDKLEAVASGKNSLMKMTALIGLGAQDESSLKDLLSLLKNDDKINIQPVVRRLSNITGRYLGRDSKTWINWFEQEEQKNKADLYSKANKNLKKLEDALVGDKVDEALSITKNILKMVPQDTIFKKDVAAKLNRRAWDMIYEDRHKGPQAELLAREAVRLDNSGATLDTLSSTMAAQAKYKEAAEYLKEALKLDPTSKLYKRKLKALLKILKK